MPSWFMRRQASMMDWRFSLTSFNIDLPRTGCVPNQRAALPTVGPSPENNGLIVAPGYSRTFRALWKLAVSAISPSKQVGKRDGKGCTWHYWRLRDLQFAGP